MFYFLSDPFSSDCAFRPVPRTFELNSVRGFMEESVIYSHLFFLPIQIDPILAADSHVSQCYKCLIQSAAVSLRQRREAHYFTFTVATL